MPIVFQDLPDDMIHCIFLCLVKDRKFLSCLHLAQTSKINYRIFIYIRDNYCPKKSFKLYHQIKKEAIAFDLDRMAIAAKNGDLDVIKLFQEDGIIFTMNTMIQAVRAGHLEIVKWLHKNIGLKYPIGTFFSIKNKNNEHMNIVKYLEENDALCSGERLDDFVYS